jgi:threonine/homoserine efflux transporter RhtA
MHRNGALTGSRAAAARGPRVERTAFRRATAIATVLQVAMVLLGLALPSLQQGNLYPIVGTLLAVLAGFLFARWISAGMRVALVGGSCAGGISSLLGVLLAALTGQAAPSPFSTVLVATITGIVSGAVGGFFGTLFREPRPRR